MTIEEAIKTIELAVSEVQQEYRMDFAAAFDVAISSLRAQQEKPFGGWISVEDELPERFQPVIICREKKRGEYIVEQGMRDVKDWWKVYGTRTKNVLFWMPMPWPPREE